MHNIKADSILPKIAQHCEAIMKILRIELGDQKIFSSNVFAQGRA